MATYKNYKLYRTNPVLSGNMKMDLILNQGSTNAEVVGYQLSPISNLVSHSNIQNENLLVRSHEMNIKRFYDTHKEYFYKPVIDPTLSSDWHIAIPEKSTDVEAAFTKTWDDTYWCGTKRISSYDKYGASFEVFCPVWIESCTGLKFTLDFYAGESDEVYKSIDVVFTYPEKTPQKVYTFHEQFSQYILDYMVNVGVADFEDANAGSDSCVNIDLVSLSTHIFGLDINQAKFVACQDQNLIKNLTYRERFMVEADSNILQLFPTHNMICPNIFNFNFILSENLLDNLHIFRNTAYRIEVSCKARKGWTYTNVDGETKNVERWIAMEKADFATNHEYIPRMNTKRSPNKTDTDLNLNALEHLNDNKVVDIIHYDKINQYVPLWCYSNNPSSIFNLYNGFGSYYYRGNNKEKPEEGDEDEAADGRGELIENNHVNGSTNADVNDESNDIDLSNWTGYVHHIAVSTNDADSIDNIIATTMDKTQSREFIDNIPLFHDATGNVGSVQFNYKSDNYDKMYVGICTTNPGAGVELSSLGEQKFITDSVQMIHILYGRFDKPYKQESASDNNGDYINSLPSNLLFNRSAYNDSDYLMEVHQTKDKIYQKFRNADALNQYGTTYGLTDDDAENGILSTNRKWSEVMTSDEYCLTCIFWEANILKNTLELSEDELEDGDTDKCLMALFFSPSYQPVGTQTTGRGYPYLGGALKIQNIIEATSSYLNRYGDVMPASLYSYLSEFVNNGVKNIETNKVINIHKTISTKIDNTLSPESKNLVPYKKDNVVDYILRPHGNIKPAIFVPAYKISYDETSSWPNIEFYNRYGLNFFWHKMIFKNREIIENGNKNFGDYAYKNIAPKYPSLKFDSVIRDKWIIGYKTHSASDEIGLSASYYININGTDVEARINDSEIYRNKYGALIYELPCPIYKGLMYDTRDPNGIEFYIETVAKLDKNHNKVQKDVLYKTHSLHPDRYTVWPEYEWFDKSIIRRFVPKFPADNSTTEFHIYVQENDKEYIEEVVWNKFINMEFQGSWDGGNISDSYIPYVIEYLKKIYKVEYNLVDSHKLEWNGVKNQYEIPSDLDIKDDEIVFNYSSNGTLLFEYNVKIKLA